MSSSFSDDIKISVVIPVYNAAPYLQRCLDSICSQSHKNLEIICINDGATDKSLEILSTYAEKEKRLVVISQENKGASAARNAGIERATGDFISFIDADDYILPGLYEKFIEYGGQSRPDIFMFNGYIGNEGSSKFFMYPATFACPVTGKEVFGHKAIKSLFFGNQSVCNKIYRTTFLKESGIRFLENNSFEDTLFYFETVIKARKIQATMECYYIYVQENDASVTKTFGRNVFTVFDTFEKMEKAAKESGVFDYYKYALFQVEYEKCNELLRITAGEVLEEFYMKTQNYLRAKQALLDSKIYTRLLEYFACHNILTLSFIDFKSTILLAGEKIAYQKKTAENPFFSVIVPIYKVEKYLETCLKSIINQTFTNFELICVNDGSPDKCGDILNQFAQKDGRIKIITQPNRGLGAARNIGALQAKGKYLAFVDSDDWLRLDALERIHSRLTQRAADMCIFGFAEFHENHNTFLKSEYISSFKKREYSDYKELKEIMFIIPCAWNKVYKRSFWEKNRLSYAQGVYFEDVATNAKAFVRAKSILISPYDLYYYRIRDDSITQSSYSEKKMDDVLTSFKEAGYFMEKEGVYATVKKDFAKWTYNSLMMHGKKMPEEERAYFYKKIKSDSAIQKILSVLL